MFRANGLRIEVDTTCYDIRGPVDTLIFQAVDYEEKCLADRRFIDCMYWNVQARRGGFARRAPCNYALDGLRLLSAAQ